MHPLIFNTVFWIKIHEHFDDNSIISGNAICVCVHTLANFYIILIIFSPRSLRVSVYYVNNKCWSNYNFQAQKIIFICSKTTCLWSTGNFRWLLIPSLVATLWVYQAQLELRLLHFCMRFWLGFSAEFSINLFLLFVVLKFFYGSVHEYMYNKIVCVIRR